MGTLSFSVGNVDAQSPSGALSSPVTTSGAHTTSTSATNVEDASGDITLVSGDVVTLDADEAMRVRFGGTAATATTGHYIPAGGSRSFICREPGNVSAIDVA